MNDFGSAYKRVEYWLNYIEQALKKPQATLRQQQPDYSELVNQVAQMRQEVSQLREEIRAGNDQHRLNRADFNETGHSFETTDGSTYTVGHYPTGRTLGELRETDSGWQARHRVDAEWQDVPAPQGEDEVSREHAGQYLEELYAGDLEANLEREGVNVDETTHYSLDQLHNAENALYQGVDKDRVNKYLEDHQAPNFKGNENSVHVDVVPGSTVWNVSDAEHRELIMNESPLAQETARKDLNEQVAAQQVNEQTAHTHSETSSEGVSR